MIQIRTLRREDVDQADEILVAAFRNPHSRKADLAHYLRLTPDGWLLCLDAGQPAGMVGAVIYDRFAYIGLMAVHPNYQRRGLGQMMLDALLELLDKKGVPMSLLDASRDGYPLYLKNGFVEEDTVRFFERSQPAPLTGPSSTPLSVDSVPARVRPASHTDLPALAAYDRPLFGADRSHVLELLLEEFPGRGFLLETEGPGCGESILHGYVFAQKQRIGPFVASSAAAAPHLLEAALALDFEEPPVVLMPAQNETGAELLAGYGFNLIRTLRHMRRGGSGLASCREYIFGQGSFALG